MKIKLASRKSDLARLQSYRVGDALKSVYPDIEIEYVFKSSLGDLNQSDPLWKMPEKGVFTEDLKKDLLNQEVDIAVHSWKDLPTEPSPDTEIIATLPRADTRDLLLVKKSSINKIKETKRFKILSSSPRRSYHLKKVVKEILPFQEIEVQFFDVRGNILTRLEKLIKQDEDALVVAKAALDRLLEAKEKDLAEGKRAILAVLSQCEFMVLPIELCPPAPAQGALAIEILKTRKDLKELLTKIHCEKTFTEVTREREVLASFGGGCHQKIGVSVQIRDWGVVETVSGETPQGEVIFSRQLCDQKGQDHKLIPKSQIFPESKEVAGVYEREKLNWDKEKILGSDVGIFVSQINALPEGELLAGKYVWAAGLKTWKKLAQKGVWVHGSSEGLGEREGVQIDLLAMKKIRWYKFSHLETEADSHLEVIPTYRLYAEEIPDLTKKTHFFWMSYFAFKKAVAKHPEIRDKHHACGPGNTYDLIKRDLGDTGQLTVYLNYEDWLKTF
jgi:hydroxymethylbilane synthase